MTPSGPPPPALEMRGIVKRFGATEALAGVDFTLSGGEVHALLGENGAGKSTLMKILSGALHPDGGDMRLDGRPYHPSDPGVGRRGGVAMIYQELTLAPHLTVEENIALGREPHRRGFLRRTEVRRKIRETLDFLHHPEIDLDARIAALGMGARQIVEIARAIMDRSRILVMDEPTSSLTREDMDRLFQVIRKLREDGVGIVYISHFLEEVKEAADRFTVLRDGRVAGAGRIAETSLGDIIRLMVGREMNAFFPRTGRVSGDVLLSVEDMKGGAMALPVSFDLRRGEILGLAGLVGSGRTETLRTIFGLDPKEEGSVRFAGKHAPSGKPWARIEAGVGLLSEDRQGEGLALSLSIKDNLTLSRLRPYRRLGFLNDSLRRSAAAGWIDRLKIKSTGPESAAGGLSGGNQQKVALARLLHQEADVLLLDEPTRGVDVGSKSQIYSWMDRLAAEGKGLLFVSSYFPELLGVCDRIAVFHRGTLVAVRPADGWTEERLLAAATTGKAS
ncbi:MAG: sugar ABC transporter ATP-binding protein [Candidatus Aminicenantes bacterium]|nr:sugar ABC transporter ATP-binding protein [Candidatus Aminicenantes bacterium]